LILGKQFFGEIQGYPEKSDICDHTNFACDHKVALTVENLRNVADAAAVALGIPKF